MRVLGELRFEFEPDDNGDDEYPELNELEKNPKTKSTIYCVLLFKK